MQKIIKLLGMKRPSSGITETVNTILFRLGNMLSTHLFQPSRRLLCPLKVKKARVEQLGHIDLTISGRNELCGCIQCLQNCYKTRDFFFTDKISLAH